MWDRSYLFLRALRVSIGTLTVCALVLGLALFLQSTSAQRAAEGLKEIRRELQPSVSDRFSCLVPSSLGTRVGSLVYRSRNDGETEIVGRVIQVEGIAAKADRISVLLTPECAGAVRNGGTLLGAGPTKHLDQAMRLLVAPEIPRDEAVRAHRMIWPAIVEHVFPRVSSRMESDLADIALIIAQEDGKLIEDTMEQLQQRLMPVEEALVRKLAERAWAEIGVWGTIQGIGRLTADSSERAWLGMRDLVVDIFAEPDKEGMRPSRGFFSPEREEALRDAMAEEVHSFWEEHQEEVIQAVNEVLKNNEAMLAEAVTERWTPQFYDRLLIPGWLEAEPFMIHAMERYAIDFTNRRLLTRRGGPRLLLAYALRSALQIAPDPLLVLQPAEQANTVDVEFDWLMPLLESDNIDAWRS